MPLAVVNTLRTIALLLLIWWLLRMLMRSGLGRMGTRSQEQVRKRGDVRVEDPDRKGQGPGDDHIIDAEYEEVR